MDSRILRLAGLACTLAVVLAAGGAPRDELDEPKVSITPRVAPRAPTGPPGAIRANVQLILVPVTVTDPLGAPFLGLPQQTFRLFEDGVEQQLRYFATQDAPVSLGIVFDASRSMTGKLDQSRTAIGRFFHTVTPGDEFLLVEFNDRPRILCNFTSNPALIEQTLVGIQPQNWTALFDAVYFAINQMKHSRNPRKALLILSDGGDNNSRYTEPEIKAFVREADICIYSVGLAGGGLIQRHLNLLKNLSDATGGLFRRVDKASDLPGAIAKIGAAIRNQYLLGYVSRTRKDDGLYHKIEVRLNPPPGLPSLRASWRAGYYAPDEQ